MNFLDYLESKGHLTSPEEELMYEFIAAEIETRDIRKGLWTKALTQNGWDEEKAKATYVKLRYSTLEKELHDYIENRSRERKEQLALNALLSNGLTQDDIDYLRNPISAESYQSKYRLSIEKIESLISKGRLKGAIVNGNLWVQDRKV